MSITLKDKNKAYFEVANRTRPSSKIYTRKGSKLVT